MLTLGVNYTRMHDSSACVVRDGELLFAVAEERISRLKHELNFLDWQSSPAWILPVFVRSSSMKCASDGRQPGQDFVTI
jgi:hypothetical protein